MDGQPGDKSPGYYRVSLRDEVKTGFQMSKLQGPSGAESLAKRIRSVSSVRQLLSWRLSNLRFYSNHTVYGDLERSVRSFLQKR